MKPSTMQTLFSLLLIFLFVIPLAQAKPSLKEPDDCETFPKKELVECRVRQIADFGVTEHNKKAGTHLKFLDLIDGCVQHVPLAQNYNPTFIVLTGKIYNFTLVAINGKNLQYCNAVVHEDISTDLQLISFELLPKPEFGNDLLPIDEGLVEQAKFAITEINKHRIFEEKFIFEKLNTALYPEGLFGGDSTLYILATLPHSVINHYYFRAIVKVDVDYRVLQSYDYVCLLDCANKFIGMVTHAN